MVGAKHHAKPDRNCSLGLPKSTNSSALRPRRESHGLRSSGASFLTSNIPVSKENTPIPSWECPLGLGRFVPHVKHSCQHSKHAHPVVGMPAWLIFRIPYSIFLLAIRQCAGSVSFNVNHLSTPPGRRKWCSKLSIVVYKPHGTRKLTRRSYNPTMPPS